MTNFRLYPTFSLQSPDQAFAAAATAAARSIDDMNAAYKKLRLSNAEHEKNVRHVKAEHEKQLRHVKAEHEKQLRHVKAEHEKNLRPRQSRA
jgi:uncharacterized protein (DUF111 family)